MGRNRLLDFLARDRLVIVSLLGLVKLAPAGLHVLALRGLRTLIRNGVLVHICSLGSIDPPSGRGRLSLALAAPIACEVESGRLHSLLDVKIILFDPKAEIRSLLICLRFLGAQLDN